MNDTELNIYNRGVKEGIKHSSPSPETLEMIDKTNNNLGVIIERIENLKCIVETNHTEDSKEHKGIMQRQDHTNGDVTHLKLWKAYLLGAWVVISFTSTILLPILGYYFINNFKHELKNELKSEISQSIEANNSRYFEE